MAFDANNFLLNVGNSPGVYQMFDVESRLLYVGKAKDLQKRLSSYFRASGLSLKTQSMVQKIASIEVVVTHTANEALILEQTLIKQHKPKYNVLLRDSKSYPYIRIDDSHAFPAVRFYRGNRSQKGRYFGPYPSANSIKTILALLQKVLPIRQCDDVYFSNRSRPCLQYQIKRCSAPCVNYIDEENYKKEVDMAALFLSGRDQSLNNLLQKQMEVEAKKKEYEKAAVWRDRILALRTVQAHQSMIKGSKDIDIICVVSRQGVICVEVSFVRAGRYEGSVGHFPKNALELDVNEVLRNFILQYYESAFIPSEIILERPLPEKEALQQFLEHKSECKIQIKHRVKEERLHWQKLTHNNAMERLQRHLAKSDTVQSRLSALQAVLHYNSIGRIECFDISHTQGDKTVASCVVYDVNGLNKSQYRRYNIDNITPGDDYAAMRQAIQRRYARRINEEVQLPDILLIDGGKGQLSSAQQSLESLSIKGIKLVGVAKGEGRKPGLETLFFTDDTPAMQLGHDSTALHLIQQIRDEAHRFAITGHRNRRSKTQTHSILQEIPGIGAVKRRRLLKHFGGLQGIKQAGVPDLMQVEGINAALANKIYHYIK